MLREQIASQWQLGRKDRRLLIELGDEATADLVAINKALSQLFPHNPMMAGFWPTSALASLNGATPVEHIRIHGQKGIKELRDLLDYGSLDAF